MIPIPDYLRQFASEISEKGTRLSFKLRCSCGSEVFDILENTYTDDEKELVEKYEESIPNAGGHTIYGGLDSDGKPYNYIKILGLFKKRIIFPQAPVFMRVDVIKTVCSQCQQEIVVFDSRYHGYYGMISDDEDARKYNPYFKQKGQKSHSIIVEIENEPSLEAFNEIIDKQCSCEFYSNAFNTISIYAIEENGKRKMLYDFETA